jgi:hypothetical protein
MQSTIATRTICVNISRLLATIIKLGMHELYLILRSPVFWDITPCSPDKFYRHFRGTYFLHLQGSRVSLLPASWWFLAWLTLQPWRWRWYVPVKRWLTFTGLHNVIPQKMELSITTAVRTSNPNTVFWSVTPCYSLVDVYRSFGGMCCFSLSLQMEAAFTSETLVNFEQTTTLYYILDDNIL